MLGELTLVLAQSDSSGPGAGGVIAMLIAMVVGLGIGLVILAAIGALMFWKVFEKAGQNPMHSAIPIYNYYILFSKVAMKPGWWAFVLIGCFIPLLNFIAGPAFFVLWILASLNVAKNFGKDVGWGVGLALLGIVFYPILGFGDSKWQPGAGGGASPPVAHG